MTVDQKPQPLSLWDMLRMRHSGEAWVFVEEVGNGTGYNVKRHADALALGLWPSRGYEIHGYEVKISRGDVRRELDDPSKADAVGKFCDHWWLVVQDLSIIDGLIIPATWGILYPKNRVLRVHRKAPKREATPVNRAFAAALIRKALENWVPKHELDELKATAKEQLKKEVEREHGWKHDAAVRDLANLQAAVKRFEEHTGVAITERYGGDEVMAMNSWQLDRIATAVKIVMNAREISGNHRGPDADDPVGLVSQELARIEQGLGTLETMVGSRKSVVFQLREMLQRMRTDVGSAG